MIPRSLEVIISDPTITNGMAIGVIPLALSIDASVDGGSTAATNPQPLLLGADYRVAETRFNVLTYGAVVGGTAAAQARVETIVVGCTCSYALADANQRGFRPSFFARAEIPGSRFATARAQRAWLCFHARAAREDRSSGPVAPRALRACRSKAKKPAPVDRFAPQYGAYLNPQEKQKAPHRCEASGIE